MIEQMHRQKRRGHHLLLARVRMLIGRIGIFLDHLCVSMVGSHAALSVCLYVT